MEFQETLENAWNSLVGPILIATVGAFFLSWLAFNRYRKEKIWDQKVKEYNRLVDAVYNIYVSFQDELSILAANRELSKKKATFLNKLHQNSKDEISRQIHVGEIFLPDAAIIELKKLEADLSKVKWENDYIGMLADSSNAIYSSLTVLKQAAKDDIVPKSWWEKLCHASKKIGAWKNERTG